MNKYRKLLEKAAPFVGWASTRHQIVAGVHATDLCDEIDAALAEEEKVEDRPLPVTEEDRKDAADFLLMGSHHETVMPARERFMAGDYDEWPLVQMAAWMRRKLA